MDSYRRKKAEKYIEKQNKKYEQSKKSTDLAEVKTFGCPSFSEISDRRLFGCDNVLNLSKIGF